MLAMFIALIVGAAKKRSTAYACPGDAARYDLTFFVIGDWGREGIADQKTAAQMMADVAGCMAPAFIISTGDNFYKREWQLQL
eukprot:jgi/Chrzof1/14931/Cz09g21070.t1